MAVLQPKVSIITPSYNQGQFIEATIQSVLNQTYKNIEYIIVDGGSTDETMNVVERYRHLIDIVIHEKDGGQSDAINKGFRLATGDVVGWINSDDVLYPDCVERLVHFYQSNPDGAVYYGNSLDRIDETGRITAIKQIRIDDRNCLLNRNYSLIQQGSFYPTKLVRQIGYLDETIHYCMDLDLWLRLLQYGPIYTYAEQPVSGFRAWEDSKTTTGGIHFLRNIRAVLQAHGAAPFSKAMLTVRYYIARKYVRQLLPIS